MSATTIQAPSRNFVNVSVSSTTRVTSAPTALNQIRHAQVGSFSRSQRRTMPACDTVKEMKTPMA